MRAKIKKTFRFEAAHRLPNHEGKCRNPHGHSYRALVTVEGRINQGRGESREGMVLDFSEVKSIWKRKIEPLVDHQDLNKTLPVLTTTAESIALWILEAFRLDGLNCVEVELWETETACAVVSLGEMLANGT